MIPKIIHYCWFGGGELPDSYKGYIRDWGLLHPEWTIRRWDESNIPRSVPYIEKAIQQKHWANVSNYVRLYALRTEGGIYMDTDMKVIQPLDRLLSYQCFLGFEAGDPDNPTFWANNAILGAVPAHHFVTACENQLLEQFDGTEKANQSSPHLTTKILTNKYQVSRYGRQLVDDIMLFEKEVFYPIPYDKVYLLKKNIKFPAETIAVHMWGRTWLTNDMLLGEVDDLRRYSHDLKDLNEKIQNDLQQSVNNLATIESSRQQAVEETNHLKELINNKLQNLELTQQQESRELKDLIHTAFNKNEQQIAALLQQQSIALLAQVELLLQQIVHMKEKYLQLQQQFDAVNLQSLTTIDKLADTIKEQERIIQYYTEAYEKSSLWLIIKRKLFKKIK